MEELRDSEPMVRSKFFDHTQSLGKRIREGETSKIPYLLIIGDKEIADDSVTVRNVATKKQEVVKRKVFVESILQDIRQRKLKASIGGV